MPSVIQLLIVLGGPLIATQVISALSSHACLPVVKLFSTFLMLQSFNTVLDAVVTNNQKIVIIATS